jgi:hypothetical protein
MRIIKMNDKKIEIVILFNFLDSFINVSRSPQKYEIQAVYKNVLSPMKKLLHFRENIELISSVNKKYDKLTEVMRLKQLKPFSKFPGYL